MPTTTLSSGSPTQLPARPLTLLVDGDGARGEVEIVVTPAIETRRPRPDMVIVPRVDQALVVSLRPIRGGVFPTPTILHLTVSVTDAVSGDHDRVIVPSLVASALPIVDVLTIESRGNLVSLRRPIVESTQPLPPAGEAAMRAARAVLRSSKVADDEAADLHVLVDASVSMAGPLKSGSLRFALDVLTGLAGVIGKSGSLAATIANDPPKRIVADPTHLASEVEAALGGCALQTGFVSSSVLQRNSHDIVTYVVTDSLVVDHYELEAAGARVHAVLLAAQDVETAVTAMSRIPVTVISPEVATTADVSTDWSEDPQLRRVIGGLVSVVENFGPDGLGDPS